MFLSRWECFCLAENVSILLKMFPSHLERLGLTGSIFVSPRTLGVVLFHLECFRFTGNVSALMKTFLLHRERFCFTGNVSAAVKLFLPNWERFSLIGNVWVSMGMSLLHWVCFCFTGNIAVTLGMFLFHWKHPCHKGYVFVSLETSLSQRVCFCFTGNVPVKLGMFLFQYGHVPVSVTLDMFLFHWERPCQTGYVFASRKDAPLGRCSPLLRMFLPLCNNTCPVATAFLRHT